MFDGIKRADHTKDESLKSCQINWLAVKKINKKQ